MDRRQFLALAAGLTTAAAVTKGAPAKEQAIDVGPASLYAANGLYDKFRDQGFFLLRKSEKLAAMSSYCTHRKCKVSAESDHTFSCKCHGSTFSAEGKVTGGPAKRDLPYLPINTSANGRLIVSVPAH